MIGALAAILIVHASLPRATEVTAYIQMREVLDDLARYLLFPSLGLVLFSGLFYLFPRVRQRSASYSRVSTTVVMTLTQDRV